MSVQATQQSERQKKEKKPMKQSEYLQYIRPDEAKTGKVNKSAIGQYPYFAPDATYLKKAPKMTKAEELYLKTLTKAVHAKEAAEVENTIVAVPETAHEEEDDYDANPRLLKERNKITEKLGDFFKKKKLTEMIFGNKPGDDESETLQ